MKKTTLLLFVILSSISFLQMDCKDDEPIIIPPIEIPPGSRDYTWTVDTLKPPPGDIVYLISMWGSSEKDIWATGFGSTSASCVWHYNGIAWQRDSLSKSSNHFSVYGFGSNDVWIVDSPNGERIWHYNGSQWSLFGNYKKSTQSLLYLENVWGNTSNNLYAVGSELLNTDSRAHAVIMNFDGKNWNYVNIADIDVSFYKIRRDGGTGMYYLSGTRFTSSGDTNMVFMFNGTTVEHITSTTKIITINEMQGKVYIQIDQKIFTPKNIELKLFKDFTNTAYRGRLWGRSEKDFFSSGANGLLHYNGTDMITIYPTSDRLYDVLVYTNEIFVLGKNGDYPIVIHGILKK